ncbi:MAG: hypothetical protein DI551_05315 [Micavibrio aeruginosavorus]|uniref:Uncharacterized protein n=1 Tax=Micavibrio aeruginosavorus TaxID=349221 RepID=A0A2W5N6F3_9BACT|nr:MAG: hypothetical protein DI551_05315 [Micavibrio aeruginosavorus]
MPPKKRGFDPSQFHFKFLIEDDSIIPLEGGSQEIISDFETALRSSLKRTVDDAGKRATDPLDRIEIAARMSRKLGREITKSHIDQWTAQSTVQRRIHADSLKALCEVTNDWGPMHCFVEACGFKALHPEEAICAEYGALTATRKFIDGKIKDYQSDMDNPELIKRLMDRTTEKGKRK